MPRKPGIYKKNDWYCSSAGGVQHQKLCRVSEGKKAAEIALARLLVAREEARQGNGQSPSPFQPATATIGDLLNEFLDHVRTNLAPRSYGWYKDKLVVFGDRFASLTPASLSYQDGLRFKEWLAQEKEWVKGKKRMRGVSPTTVNHFIRAAKTFLNWASKPSRQARTGLLQNPWVELRFNPEKGRERLVTEEELSHLLAQCADGNVAGGAEDFREQILLLRYTSLRSGELRALRWGYFQHDLHRLVFPPSDVKGRRRREVALIERAEELLLERKRRLLALGAGCADGDYVFPKPGRNEEGALVAGLGKDQLDAHGFVQRFRRLFMRCVRLGLIQERKGGERFGAHSLRHNRLTELCLEGHPLALVQAEAGHTTPQMTAKYLHLAQSQIADRIRAADQAKRNGASGGEG